MARIRQEAQRARRALYRINSSPGKLHDAYLYLVDQAEGLTDEQRIELGQLAQLSDREAFWDLFNKSVSPLTSYRIESHTLQMQPNLFKA